MNRDTLKQITHLLAEIHEEEHRKEIYGAWSLFDEDGDTARKNAEKIKDIRGWIHNIPDAAARRAFSLRYLDGLSWCAVAVRMGYTSPDTPRKICDRYLSRK